jgi:hypothetical protein
MIEGELGVALSRPMLCSWAEAAGRRSTRGRPHNGSPARPPVAITAGNLCPSYNRGAAREIEHSPARPRKGRASRYESISGPRLLLTALIASTYLAGTNTRLWPEPVRAFVERCTFY